MRVSRSFKTFPGATLPPRRLQATCGIRQISSDTEKLRDSQAINLSDGRRLGYAEYGSKDGYPLIYLHGFPASRLEGTAIDDAAQKRRIRLLALERPGFGISTFQQNRCIIDYPKDVKAFADALGVKRFALVGCSGGGPYALACAHLLPRQMLSGVGLLATGGPHDESQEGIPFWWRVGRGVAHHTPSIFGAATSGFVGAAKWLLRTDRGTRWINQLVKGEEQTIEASAEKKDMFKKEKTPEETREEMIRLLFEGLAQGSQATVQEAQLLSKHWGFNLEDIDYEPIHIWHGQKDSNAPIEWIRPMARRIPHAKLTEFEGETHGSVLKHLDWMLSQVVPEQPASDQK